MNVDGWLVGCLVGKMKQGVIHSSVHPYAGMCEVKQTTRVFCARITGVRVLLHNGQGRPFSAPSLPRPILFAI